MILLSMIRAKRNKSVTETGPAEKIIPDECRKSLCFATRAGSLQKDFQGYAVPFRMADTYAFPWRRATRFPSPVMACAGQTSTHR